MRISHDLNTVFNCPCWHPQKGNYEMHINHKIRKLCLSMDSLVLFAYSCHQTVLISAAAPYCFGSVSKCCCLRSCGVFPACPEPWATWVEVQPCVFAKRMDIQHCSWQRWTNTRRFVSKWSVSAHTALMCSGCVSTAVRDSLNVRFWRTL